MAPESIESIKSLFDDAEHDGKRIEYLFRLIFKSSEDTKESFKLITGEIKKMQAKCDMRKVVCDENYAKKNGVKDIEEEIKAKTICFKKKEDGFITRKQAYGVGVIIVLLCFALSIGIGIGTKELTKTQALKEVTEKLIPP